MSLTLPFKEWPKSDQIIWVQLFTDGGPLDDLGPFGHYRATTQKMMMAYYGRWLAWLEHSGRARALSTEPAEVCTRSALQAWVNDLGTLRPVSRLLFVSNVLRILRAAFPEQNWDEQQKFVSHLQRKAGRGDPHRKSGRVLSSGVIFDAAVRHVGTAEQDGTTELSVMKQRRSGTMVALLALMPMRLRAFGELRIGSSFLVKHDRLTVLLSAEMTKTGVPWEADVPWQISGLLRAYLIEVRPWFHARHKTAHDSLWLNDHGRPFELNHLSSKIGKTTEQLTGKKIRPHLFRDAAATTLSVESPAAARLITAVLGHSHTGTAERHYIRADSINAGHQLAAAHNRRRTTS